MTVSSTLNKISYRGNGIVKEFAIPFRFFENTEIKVYMVSAVLPETLLILGDDYTVSGADSENGGAVLMNVAPEEDERLTIIRVVQMMQEVDYRENEIFPAETQERALDKLTMMVQQNAEKLNRTLTLGVTSSEKPDEIIPLIFNAQTESANSAVLAAEKAQEAVLVVTGFDVHAEQIKQEIVSAGTAEADRAASEADRAQAYAYGVSFGNIGDIKWSMRSDCPIGAAWCDGSEYGETAFPQVFDMLVRGDLPSVSYEAYAAELEAHHGNCGRFALDAVNKKFRVPLLHSVYIGATSDFMNAGEYKKDSVGVHKHATMIGSSNAAAFLPGYTLSTVPSGNKQWAASGTESIGMGASMTDNGRTIPGNDAPTDLKTRPETVLMRAYAVMYTAAVEAGVVQAAELMTALSGKLNADLSNITEKGQKGIVQANIPDNESVVEIPVTLNLVQFAEYDYEIVGVSAIDTNGFLYVVECKSDGSTIGNNPIIIGVSGVTQYGTGRLSAGSYFKINYIAGAARLWKRRLKNV